MIANRSDDRDQEASQRLVCRIGRITVRRAVAAGDFDADVA
ncbi:MAG TPA: hypothetical protein VK968_09220 [Roseimicrobium sp.]|nr:hypothetical protein [Roseimicrobium sp.]